MPATTSIDAARIACLVAAVLCGCAGPADDPDDPLVCVWTGEGRPTALTSIGCPDDFEALAAPPLSTALPGVSSVKFLIDLASLDPADDTGCAPTCAVPEVCAGTDTGARCAEYALYFQDTQTTPLHHGFAAGFLSGDCDCDPACAGSCDCAVVERRCSLPLVPDLNTFNAVEYRQPTRRFLLGSVDHHQDQDLYTLDLAPVDTASAAMVEHMFRAVQRRAYFGDALRFLPQSVLQEAAAAELPGDIPVITTADLYRGLAYQPLNPGEAVGQVRILRARDLEDTYVSPREIVVLDSVPNDISPVAGIITAAFQTPLAHVNVLSRNRGTPNMGLRDATTDERITALDGAWARLTVGTDDWSLAGVTPAEADAWWEEHKPPPLEVPAMDLGVSGLIDLADVGLDAMPAVGAKAANFAELQRVAHRPRRSFFDRPADMGALPPPWSAPGGDWAQVEDPRATSGTGVLRQADAGGGPHVAGIDKTWRNFACSVHVIADAGNVAGLAFLHAPDESHFVVRLDGGDLSLDDVDPDGTMTPLAVTPFSPPAGAVVIEARVHDRLATVTAQPWPSGPAAELVFLLPAHPPGASCLLWTTAGATAAFDDFSLAPVYNPRAFAVPFSWFRQFMEQNGFDDELAALLADSAFRADGNVRRCELARLRERMQRGEVDPALTSALDAKLAADYPGMRMRFRSSTNAEDLGSYTGAGLYTSRTGEPGDPDRPVLSALRTVWASLFNFRAFEEREILGIPHDRVGMAVLVHRSYPWELANGVAITNNVFDTNEPAYYVNVQPGEASVTNPEPGELPDQFLYYWSSLGSTTVYLSRSTLTDGEPVLSEAEIHELALALQAIHLHFSPFYGASFYAMDTEFKLDWPDRALVIKQARPFPRPGE